MYILGLGGWSHDASACLIKDGEVIAAAQEERFTRQKHQKGIPHKTIEFCLKKAGITIDAVEHIGFYADIWLGFRWNIFRSIQNLLKSPKHGLWGIFQEISDKGLIGRDLFNFRPKVKFIEHHFAHAAGVFNVSPFEEAAILSMDAVGERTCTALFYGRGNKIEKLTEILWPHSWGFLYSHITHYIGFEAGEDEYKIMGLAPYGKPSFYEALSKLIIIKPNGLYEFNLKFFKNGLLEAGFSEKIKTILGEKRKKDEPVTQKHKDIAASLQKMLEETALNLSKFLYKNTGAENLCIAGGVGLNSVMNGRLLKDSHFKRLYISPAAGDLGTALGCAYYIYNNILGQTRNYVEEHAFYGPSFFDEEIQEVLDSSKLKYEMCKDNATVARRCAELLSKGNIIGWFQGAMEWGPRALGARSILADPRRDDMKDKVNISVKHREEFRPFAPSVLEEISEEWFNLKQPSPFMAIVCDVYADKAKKIPAVVHVDSTARVQTVSKNTHPLYWHMIKEFENITSVPVVLNTSFNVRGEPIVCTPEDAVRCFYSTGLDYLFLGKYVLKKGN